MVIVVIVVIVVSVVSVVKQESVVGCWVQHMKCMTTEPLPSLLPSLQ